MTPTRTLTAAAVLAAGLTACGGGDTPQAAPAATSTPPAAAPSAPAPVTTASPSPTPTLTTPSAAPSATASQSSPLTMASPEPTQLTVEEAAATYLRLVKPYNTANTRKNRLLDANASIREITRATRPVADANFQLGKELRKVQWPDEVAAEIEQLADITAQQTGIWREMTRADSRAEYDRISEAFNDEESGRVVATIRQKLDLDEAPQ